MQMLKDLWKSKTFWASISAILIAVGGYLGDQLPLPEMLKIVGGAAVAIFMRHAIEKAK
jgi:hypothetical protein